MRALIVSSDRFEDSELSEPLQQLQAKGDEVDIAAPQQGPITGKHGLAVRAEDYDLLLPGGEAPASLRKVPEAVAIARHFLQADKPVAAIAGGGASRHAIKSCGPRPALQRDSHHAACAVSGTYCTGPNNDWKFNFASASVEVPAEMTEFLRRAADVRTVPLR